MYAVIKDGGHQIRAAAGEEIEIEHRDLPVGQELVFDQVLLIGGDQPRFGNPTVPGARVVAVVSGASKGPKVHGLRTREKDSSQTRFGHRQLYTIVKVREIVTG